jgi:GAF domain-containing protein
MEHEADGLDRLLRAVQELAMARSLDDVVEIVRHAAREVTGADGATFILRDGGHCYYVDEDAIEPLWSGQRFPLENCVSGWAMLNKDVAVIPDIYADERVPHAAYRPTFVHSMVMVPIRSLDPVGAIGNYWSVQHEATEREVRFLRALADATSVSLESVTVREELNNRVSLGDHYERLSSTDEMTGLLNRRGFAERTPRAIAVAHSEGIPVVLGYLDLNGLKTINDTEGHAAGDAAIVAVAEALRVVGGSASVLGRLGGDEF